MNKPPDIPLRPPDPYKAVKTSLKSIVQRDDIQNTLMKVVLTAHNLMRHTSQFLKMYLLHEYEANKPLPEVNAPFVLHVMKTIGAKTETRGRPPCKKTMNAMATLGKFHLAHYAPLMKDEVITYTHLDNVMKYLCTDVVTSYENNIKQHFVEYIERFVNVFYDHKEAMKTMSADEKYQFLAKLRKIKKAIMNQNSANVPQELKEHYKFLLPQRKLKECLKYDLECNPQDYLPCMIYMMKFVESKEKTILNVFPLRNSMIPNNVPIDTKTIICLFGNDLFMGKGAMMTDDNLKKYEDFIWGRYFKKYENVFNYGRNYRFAHRIVTDGEGVTILFEHIDPEIRNAKKPKKAPRELYFTDLEGDGYEFLKQFNIATADPGTSDLLYFNGLNTEGDMKHFRYTQNQRRKETKMKKYRNIHEELKKNTTIEGKTIKEYEIELSKFNKKTVSFENFKNYVKARNEIYKKIHSFYEQKVFTRLRWYSYINRQRTESNFMNRFKSMYGDATQTIVYIGDWEQFKHRMFKEPVKGKGFRKLFRRYGYIVLLVDEFRTSCRCAKCDGECVTFRKCQNPRPWKKEEVITRHGLLTCKKCGRIWNRDENGSLNIYRIVRDTLDGKGRPEILRRGQEVDDDTQPVKKKVTRKRKTQ